MSATLLATKLHIPPPRPGVVPRPRLLERLTDGLHRKLTLISAPAGFGKTTLVSEWLARGPNPTAWLSLDDGDSDPTRFLSYLVAALQTIAPDIGEGVQGALRSPQPPPLETLLTALLNELATAPEDFVLVLDDYHLVDARPVDEALTFLLEHLPPQLHLVIATREDPQLPLARLRARGQLSELRAADLRFTLAEAAAFLNQVMGLSLAADDIAALESRTEGWIVGLQLAAISMQGRDDASSFIQSFSASHRFVLDYLVEEVLQRQPERVQRFLLRTSILDRMCGALCDAILQDSSLSGQDTLEYLEQANLFIVPLDDERRWYRYHHLFAELLRQRLHQSSLSLTEAEGTDVAELHVRASQWFEENGLEFEAFRHAVAADDIARAERLARGKGIPLYVRGGTAPVLNWLESLPPEVMDEHPSLRVMFAGVLAVVGQVTRVEPILQAAEVALKGGESEGNNRDLTGRIADLRALLALLSADPGKLDTIIAQSRRALEYLHPDDLSGRASTLWKMGLAFQYQGNRVAARDAYAEAIAASEPSGNIHVHILATTGLGKMRETGNQLHDAAESYRRVLHLAGEPPRPVACEAYAGLARLFYEWNDLDTAERYGRVSVRLARQIEISSFVTSELIVARAQLAQGDVSGAIATLFQTEQDARNRNFSIRLPEIAAMQVLALIRQGDLEAASHLAQSHDLPVSQARVQLACGNPSIALELLATARRQAEANGWVDERLKVMVLEAVALDAHGEQDKALRLLGEALAVAEPGGFIRLFVDDGVPMSRLLADAAARGVTPQYARKLLSAFEDEGLTPEDRPHSPHAGSDQPLVEPLSPREIEVLQLVAQGLSNREISERLFVALSTVKGHNRIIFDKLDVRRRTEAVARARELGLL